MNFGSEKQNEVLRNLQQLIECCSHEKDEFRPTAIQALEWLGEEARCQEYPEARNPKFAERKYQAGRALPV